MIDVIKKNHRLYLCYDDDECHLKKYASNEKRKDTTETSKCNENCGRQVALSWARVQVVP